MFDYSIKIAMKSQSLSDFRRVANALALAALVQESTTVIDRMAYALTPEQSVRALNDALRTIASVSQGSTSFQVSQVQVKKEENTYTFTEVKEREGNMRYKIPGGLPTQEEVTDFIDAVTADVRLARKVGAVALSLYVRAKQEVSKGEVKS
ncbi:CRISPR type I-A/APERN-associated protein Csa5 [Metallosphaera yellowstonensis MK1]|uniref:CRISPR type I-A/APERN-associated protein Csa5 n=1 Tax=Metallosphaera yellowstonensis MK1 TaxID=671065 RepID=H2C0V9_9CREN|nr:type I-A CRISPR-associated protein Csa5 [Metallosphaera yellowstonensis]EHP69908.1 CRISPR type I-A/APERN-associated protein Csa5 [Metallosphaera yellowstonensis MK1]